MDIRTVGELRRWLADQPADRLVILQKDAEGNGYSPIADATEAMYVAASTWSGEVYPTQEELVQLVAQGSGWDPEDDAAPDDAVRVVVLGPTN